MTQVFEQLLEFVGLHKLHPESVISNAGCLCVCVCPHCASRLYIDGPFGSPSEEVFNYDVSVCVAGGIGVTPFACVLHALL